MKKGGDHLVPFHKNLKYKLLALDIFRAIRPFSRVQIDTEDQDYGYPQINSPLIFSYVV